MTKLRILKSSATNKFTEASFRSSFKEMAGWSNSSQEEYQKIIKALDEGQTVNLFGLGISLDTVKEVEDTQPKPLPVVKRKVKILKGYASQAA